MVAPSPEGKITPAIFGLPTLTPEPPTSTATEEPRTKLKQNANCRRGPGTLNGIVTSLLKDEPLQIEGKSAGEPKSWWILLPQSTAHCWVSESIVEMCDSFDEPPVMPAPPTPEPTEEEQVVEACMHQGPDDNKPVCTAPCPDNPNPGGACTP